MGLGVARPVVGAVRLSVFQLSLKEQGRMTTVAIALYLSGYILSNMFWIEAVGVKKFNKDVKRYMLFYSTAWPMLGVACFTLFLCKFINEQGNA